MKRLFRTYLFVLRLGILLGMAFGTAAYAVLLQPTPLGAALGALTGAVEGLLIMSVAGGIDNFLPHSRIGRGLDRAPFLATLCIKALLYGAVVVLVIGSDAGPRLAWNLAEGRPDARPLACYFAVQQALELAAGEFKQAFGAVPQLRSALHAGPVITGEVGGSRRALVFHGDVMNTTARLENATRELGLPFLVSGDALGRLDGLERYRTRDLGLQPLRGRTGNLQVHAVELAAAPDAAPLAGPALRSCLFGTASTSGFKDWQSGCYTSRPCHPSRNICGPPSRRWSNSARPWVMRWSNPCWRPRAPGLQR